MRTIKEILNSGEEFEEYHLPLMNGQIVEGMLVRERVCHNVDTEGYNVYDIRTGYTDDGREVVYSSLEPHVIVDWADSIATKQVIDFGEKGYLEIDNDY